MKNYWTTAQGEKLEYKDLSDDHLKNIINDGYRSPFLELEAAARKFDYPDRLIDKLSLKEYCMYVESFASCAIEGNEIGVKMMGLYNTDKATYNLCLNLILEKEKIENEQQTKKTK